MKRACLLISLLLIGLSCSEAPFDPFSGNRGEATPLLLSGPPNGSGTENPSDSLLELDSTMVISLVQVGPVAIGSEYDFINDPVVVIHQYTERHYLWQDMSIRQEIDMLPGSIQITHTGILKPGTDSGTLDSVYHYSTFGMPEGSYDLYCRYKEVIDYYIITIDENSIVLTPVDTNYTRPGNRLILRDD